MVRRFEDEFQDERGDVVYGLADMRNAYLSKLSREAAFRIAAKMSWVVLNEYNGFWKTAELALDYEPSEADAMRAGLTPSLENLRSMARRDVADETHGALHRIVAFGDRLLDSRFGLGAFERPGKEYAPLPTTQWRLFELASARYREEAMLRATRAIRRTCKMGIGMVASDPAFTSRGAKVHFVLDGVDTSRVIAKAREQDEQGTPGMVPISTSELRYIYRNWEELSGTVLFYLDGVVVAAPWEGSGQSAWALYGQARLAKYHGVLPRKTLLNSG